MFFFSDLSSPKRYDCVHHNPLQCAALAQNLSLHEILVNSDISPCTCACHQDPRGNSLNEGAGENVSSHRLPLIDRSFDASPSLLIRFMALFRDWRSQCQVWSAQTGGLPVRRVLAVGQSL